MPLGKMKPFYIGAVFFGALFAVFFSIRVDILGRLRPINTAIQISGQALRERDTWMNVIQNNRKISYSHSVFSKDPDGYLMTQKLFMRINTMGMIHSINLTTEGRLHTDFTLSAFNFRLNSGRFSFAAYGSVSGEKISVRTESAGNTRTLEVPIDQPPYLAAGMYEALWAGGLEPGKVIEFSVFDPATMGQAPVRAEVIGEEAVEYGGDSHKAKRVVINFKGITQEAWIGNGGEVLREKGFLGITLEKTDRENALFGLPVTASQDLTQTVSVASNVQFENPAALQRLQLEISGVNLGTLQVEGGRQKLKGNLLQIEKESTDGLGSILRPSDLTGVDPRLLAPTPFIQSDHERIRNLVRGLVAETDPPLEKIVKIVSWIQTHIERRPVISMPDALSVLENRSGDCNEHSVLLAAMARAAGIPAQIEAGLVYLRGRFYYHAWNRVYLGRWITVDALFNQIPSDVTHIRFSVGSPDQQLDLMGVIGKIGLRVIETEGA